MLVALGATAFAVAEPGFDPSDCRLGTNAMPGTAGTVTVNEPGNPATYPTIQKAVDAASPGFTVLVYPGEYREAVRVGNDPNTVVVEPDRAGLRIRGTDRDGVVLNGETTRNYGITVWSDRVMIENMTGHSYKNTAFYWVEQTGYWGRNLTAYNNGNYGIYAYQARCGQFDYSLATGNGDSGFYIGGCFPCDAVIEHIESAYNALGYSGTNAGGNLTLRDSFWHNNGLGIVPNSLNGEPHPPQRGISIEYNDVTDNNEKEVPGTGGVNNAFWGGGIVIAGGAGNEVFGNTITGHELAGIVLAPLADVPNPEYGLFPVYLSQGNTIWGNKVHGAPADGLLGADLVQSATSGPGNCWANNDFGSSAPPAPVLETVWQCGLPLTPPGGDPRLELSFIEGVAGWAIDPADSINGRKQVSPFTYPSPSELGAAVCSVVPAACDDSSGAPLTEWLPALALS
jgi:hypothetical protein